MYKERHGAVIGWIISAILHELSLSFQVMEFL